MARTRQVRLEPDVVALLSDDDGLDASRSLSAAANRVIRDAYADPDPGVVQDPGRVDPDPIPQPRRPNPPHVHRRGLVGRPKGPGSRVSGGCRHPASRMVGARCGLCGQEILR